MPSLCEHQKCTDLNTTPSPVAYRCSKQTARAFKVPAGTIMWTTRARVPLRSRHRYAVARTSAQRRRCRRVCSGFWCDSVLRRTALSHDEWAAYIVGRTRAPKSFKRWEWLQSCEYQRRICFWFRHIDDLVPLPSLSLPCE